jgi:FlaA1/EpsC-like NDP-sugar epimerase
MVTGAAGSIGSDMSYRIARFKPAALVGYYTSETALFYLEREMREKFPDVRFHPEIGNVQNSRRSEALPAVYRLSLCSL